MYRQTELESSDGNHFELYGESFQSLYLAVLANHIVFAHECLSASTRRLMSCYPKKPLIELDRHDSSSKISVIHLSHCVGAPPLSTSFMSTEGITLGMEVPAYSELDPDGDVVLILKSWNKGVIVHDMPTPQPSPVANKNAIGVVSSCDDLFSHDEIAEEMIAEDEMVRQISIFDESPIEKSMADQDGAGLQESPTLNDIGSEDESESEPEHQQIRFRVSSKHLTLASSVFKAMLAREFKEGATLRSTGTIDLHLPDDHPAALLICLNIVHGDSKKVPRKVDLRMLAEIAIIVDKYELHNAVGIKSYLWIDCLKDSIPQSFNEDLLRWICISWVFKCTVEFRESTRIAEQQSVFNVEEEMEDNLPIPDSVISKLLLSSLRSTLNTFRRDQFS